MVATIGSEDVALAGRLEEDKEAQLVKGSWRSEVD